MIPLLTVAERWECPNCDATETTRGLPGNAARFHVCPGLHMLNAPLIRAGTDCKVIAVERQDNLNGEIQATGDDGRPYMAVVTVRADGSNDALVNPGAAVMRIGAQ